TACYAIAASHAQELSDATSVPYSFRGPPGDHGAPRRRRHALIYPHRRRAVAPPDDLILPFDFSGSFGRRAGNLELPSQRFPKTPPPDLQTIRRPGGALGNDLPLSSHHNLRSARADD